MLIKRSSSYLSNMSWKLLQRKSLVSALCGASSAYKKQLLQLRRLPSGSILRSRNFSATKHYAEILMGHPNQRFQPSKIVTYH